MNTALYSIGDFITVLPVLTVWLAAILYCAYRYDDAPARFVSTALLLTLMVFVSVFTPFAELMLWSFVNPGMTHLHSGPSLIDAVSTLGLLALPPFGIVAIALFTAAPKREP